MAHEEHLKVLRTNIAAVQALVDTVAGTLGPKGLDILLVDETGRMVLTNDGIEILRQSDFQHPAARLAVEHLKAQEQQVGDGTTTATVLTGGILSQSMQALEQGVPVNLLLKGIQRGIQVAIAHLQETAHFVTVTSPDLYQVALMAARGDDALARMVWEAAQHVGTERLATMQLADWVVSRVGSSHQLIPGVVVGKPPLMPPAQDWQGQGKVLVLADSLEPENTETAALGTERGFTLYLEAQQQFRQALETLRTAGVRLIVTEKGIAPAAESFLYEHDILALQRVIRRDRERIAAISGARPMKTNLLYRPLADITPHLGEATLYYQTSSAQLRLEKGAGEPQATILVGALSEEVAAEQERIAADACGALQAALRSGIVTGGGVAEWSCREALKPLLATTEDLSRYGIQAVYAALARPLEQIIVNSGYPPLEKIALMEANQGKNPHVGLDCETGALRDLAEAGILDPAAVKIQALTVAGEIALRILRIQTLIRRRPDV
jgi:archaeal chaperonin